MTRLALHDFRNYAEAEIELPAGPVVLMGRNGQGKTNIVEAIGYLSTLTSHRVAQDAPLVRSGAEFAVVRAVIRDHDRDTLVEFQINPGRANRARVSGAPLRRPRDVLGELTTVLFAPEDLALVKGDPAGRRRFLDELLTQRLPRYAGVRADYERVVRQRNSLLKSAYPSRRSAVGAGNVESTLAVWDDQLVELGAELLVGRLQLVTDLASRFTDAYAQVAPESSSAGLRYVSRLAEASAGDGIVDLEHVTGGLPVDRQSLADLLRQHLAQRRREELARAITLVGPHRDDVAIEIGALPAKGYASHGESWSAALALRVASFHLLRDEAASDPVLMLDDVFAELDVGRRERLAAAVEGVEQVVITAAVADDVPESLAGQEFTIQAGTIASGRGAREADHG